MHRTILLVEDDPSSTRMLQRVFERLDWTVRTAYDGRSALELAQRDNPEIILLDLGLPDIRGLDLLELLRAEDLDTAVIVVTGSTELHVAVEAMRRGAENFLPKPIKLEHLEAVVERAYEKVVLRRQNRVYLDQQIRGPQGSLEPAVAISPHVQQKIDLMSNADTLVLLQGETGTGKSMVARMIHAGSSRARQPFVEVNCAGLSPALLESELFGHEKGAFTDAKTQKRGLFEVADGGTVFLDEIGDLAPELQPKLLTALETRRFRRVGGTREIEVDVRLIAATNRDLQQDVLAGRFRQDLYYRIAVYPLTLPPLREWSQGEIVQLAYSILHNLRARMGHRTTRISDEVLAQLIRLPWPGNVRELRNILERCVINSRDAGEIQLQHMPSDLVSRGAPVGSSADYDTSLTLEEVERRHITRVLQACDGNRSRAAQVLGISRRSIYDRIQRMEIDA